MAHWTSHAFHATVVSPSLMYDDVTMGFSDGMIVFQGRPLRNWRAWLWIGWVVRLMVAVLGAVALASVVLLTGYAQGITTTLVLRASGVITVWMAALWLVRTGLHRYTRTTRERTKERIAKVPIGDVSMARLSGRTLVVRAPLDERNRSGRWRFRVDSHDQGESLLALLGRR